MSNEIKLDDSYHNRSENSIKLDVSDLNNTNNQEEPLDSKLRYNSSLSSKNDEPPKPIQEQKVDVLPTLSNQIKTEESTEPIEHSTQLLIEDQTKHTVKEKTVKKHTPLTTSRLQPKKKKQKQKKTQSENEVVILPSLEVQPFDKHYRLVFFTTVELFNKKVRIRR